MTDRQDLREALLKELRPEQRQAVHYLRAYWRLHPQMWEEVSGEEISTTQMRREHFEAVNVVSEGDLQRLVGDPNRADWVIAFGVAVAMHYNP